MSKKKGKGQDRLTEEILENFLKMMELAYSLLPTTSIIGGS